MGEIINVIDLAKSIKGQIAEFISQRANNGEIIPKIASIVVGEDLFFTLIVKKKWLIL